MSKTVRRRVLASIVNKLRFLTDNAVIDRDESIGPFLDIALSGTYTGSLQKYKVEILNATDIEITDVTALGSPSTETVTSGVPIALGASGISITLTFSTDLTSNIGSIYYVRMANYTETVSNVFPWFRSSSIGRFPAISVWDVIENKRPILIERYDCTLVFTVILHYKDGSLEDPGIYDIVGDIESLLTEDNNLKEDDGTCLVQDVLLTQSEVFTTEGSQEVQMATITGEVNYRHAYNNPRELK